MVWSRASRLPADLTAPAAARDFVQTTYAGLYASPASMPPDVCEDLLIIVSELVTNAVQAAATSVEIAMEVADGQIRLAVTDQARGMPTVTGPAAFDQPYGRGLAIVAALSRDWGVLPLAVPASGGAVAGDAVDGGTADEAAASPGKTVWARLDLGRPPDGAGF